MNINLVYVHQLDDLKDTGNLINIAYNDYYPGGKARDYTKNIFNAAKDLYGHFIAAQYFELLQ